MFSQLATIDGLHVIENASLAHYTRFAIGGPARLLADASTESALVEAIGWARDEQLPMALIGGGTNLVAADAGFQGLVLRYTASEVRNEPNYAVTAQAGVFLHNLVNYTIESGQKGLETMTGIPGWLGGAIYGNAGAYGHSIQERIESVRFFDGETIRELGNAACEFRYRESVFKRRKDWVILSATLKMEAGESAELRSIAEGILKIRNEKYPPTMRCAGSIFKNLILAELPPVARANVPPQVIREGKVPSAYFLEQVGAKGMIRGGIHVAEYHANLLYNSGNGTADEVRDLVEHLKARVRQVYGLELEEEVQYLGGVAAT